MNVKSDNMEIEKRLNLINQWILQGYSNSEIEKNSFKKWKISSRQTRNYISKCFQNIKDSFQDEQKNLVAKHLAMRFYIYRECLKNNERRTASSILKDIGELQGLYKQRIEHSGHLRNTNANIDLSHLSDEELIIELNKLK